MKKNSATLLFFSLLCFVLQAAPVRYFKIRYIVQEGQDLSKIYREFVKDESIVKRSTPMVQRTMNSNSEVEDWENLEKGERFDLYISEDFLDRDKLEKYKEMMREKIASIREKMEEKKEKESESSIPKPKGLKASAFYMASYGMFTQTGNELADLTFQQNSPVSLGTSFSYYPEKGPWSYAWSLYFSHLIAASNNLNTEIIDIPLEIGGNIYAEYRFKNFPWTGYAGLDFERFHTFNLPGLRDERTIFLDENQVFYLTVGGSRLVKVFGQSFFTKLSLSKSFISKTSPTYTGDVLDEDFDGFKVLWYVNKKISERFYLHTLFKYHKMSGPSDLSVTRIGAGIGYILF